MGRFRERVREVDAMPFMGDNVAELAEFVGPAARVRFHAERLGADGTPAYAELDNGAWYARVEIGDWVVRDNAGEFGVIKPDAFHDRYQAVV